MIRSFKEAMLGVDGSLLRLERFDTLQANLGNVCNQRCRHCHVNAGPDGKNVMSREVMGKIIEFLQGHRGLCLDMTGGCPELNPEFRYLIENAFPLVDRMIVRTNLTVLFEPGLEWTGEWYRGHGVVVVGSLPCYTEENVDAQRGAGVFDKSIAALRLLNDLGYGREEGLELDLVYNPGGGYLGGSQEQLEAEYKERLIAEHGVAFSKLFTITNAPVGRFRQYLEANGELEKYLRLLEGNFNAAAAVNVMCRRLLSVDYRGVVYNCDFNQALGMPVRDSGGNAVSIDGLDEALGYGIDIVTDEHCYCCTAGAGSSCTGTLVK